MMNITQLGSVIRENRVAQHLSQGQLAENSGVAIKSIYSIEMGTGNPSVGTLNRILKVLQLELIVISKKS
jgi:transcriptional regulator with XRE-family HTH domain